MSNSHFMATNKVTVNNLWQEEILVSSTTTTAVVLPMDHQWQVTSRAWVVDMKKPHSTHKVLGGVGELSINPLLPKLLEEGTVTWMAWLVITLILKVHYVNNRDLMKLWWWCGGAEVQVTGHRSQFRSQVRLQATGHRSDHRPQVRSQVTHKNNRTLGKTVLDWRFTIQNNISQGTLMIFLSFKQY